jgi:hypothetical protein
VEAFKFTRQSVAVLVMVAVIALVVAVAAPFGSIALGALALLALGVVLVKALLRTRYWWPLTAIEGTLALSSVVLVCGGIAVAGVAVARMGTEYPTLMIGWPIIHQAPGRPDSRPVWHSDPDTRDRLKYELAKAGIPFTTEMHDGREFIRWPAEHDPAAQHVWVKVRDEPGRNVYFSDPALRQEFVDWLSKKGIKHELVQRGGKDLVVWEGADDLTHQFMKQRASRDCKKPC